MQFVAQLFALTFMPILTEWMAYGYMVCYCSNIYLPQNMTMSKTSNWLLYMSVRWPLPTGGGDPRPIEAHRRYKMMMTEHFEVETLFHIK